MPEPTPPRTIAEIQADYQQQCVRAGHLNYQLFALNEQICNVSRDLEVLNAALRTLNIEAAAAQATEAKAPAASEPAAAEEAPSAKT